MDDVPSLTELARRLEIRFVLEELYRGAQEKENPALYRDMPARVRALMAGEGMFCGEPEKGGGVSAMREKAGASAPKVPALGFVDGVTQGIQLVCSNALREILRERFGKLPDNLPVTTNLERLRRLAVAAACVDSLATFAAVVEQERCELPGGDALRESLAPLLEATRRIKVDNVLENLEKVVRKTDDPSLHREIFAWAQTLLARESIPGDWTKEPGDISEARKILADPMLQFADGLDAGMSQAQWDILRGISTDKFGATLPGWLAAETDVERLRRLTMAAACSDSITAFAAQLEAERTS